jgi:type I pantothenate kinase
MATTHPIETPPVSAPVADVIPLRASRPTGAAIARIAAFLVRRAQPGVPLVVGVTGSVAAGKTSFCSAISARLRHARRIETISTDGFLMSNEVLAERDLSRRKGYPESYDGALMSGVLQRARWGPIEIPGYSHTRHDVDPSLAKVIDRPDILLVEGLGLSPATQPRNPPALLDALIYIDATEQDLEAWFVARFLKFWRDTASDPKSFYARFRSMTETDVAALARSVWADVNLPNLRNHIIQARDIADIVVRKDKDHVLGVVRMIEAGF